MTLARIFLSLRCADWAPALLASVVLVGTPVLSGCSSRGGLLRDYASAMEAERSGQPDAAARIYRSILERDKHFEGAHNNLALIEAGSGRLDAALREVEAELLEHPSATSARTNEVILLLRAGGHAAARSKAEALVASGSAEPLAFLLLGLSHLSDGGDVDRGLQALEEASVRGTSSVRAWARSSRGVVLAQRGDLDGAAADFEEVTRLRPDAVAQFDLAVCEAKRGRIDAAKTAATRAGALDPKAAPVAVLEARIALALHDLPGVEAAAARAMALGADDEVILIRGWARLEKGDHAGARVDFGAVTTTSRRALAAYGIALSAVADHDLALAQKHFADAVALDPTLTAAAKNRDALRDLLGI